MIMPKGMNDDEKCRLICKLIDTNRYPDSPPKKHEQTVFNLTCSRKPKYGSKKDKERQILDNHYAIRPYPEAKDLFFNLTIRKGYRTLEITDFTNKELELLGLQNCSKELINNKGVLRRSLKIPAEYDSKG